VTENGIVIAVIALVSAVLVALIAVWRFRRKDRADAQQVEEGTISGRFKDADALMRYIDERVDERTAALAAELADVREKLKVVGKESHEMNDAVRANATQQWLWDHRGRVGVMPMLPGPILTRLGLGHLTDPDFDNTENPLMPPGGTTT
jgi:hypothetical protein